MAQEKTIIPLDLKKLQDESKAYQTEVIDKIGTSVDMFRAMSIPIEDINELVSEAGTISECKFLRIYSGVGEGKQTLYVLPVDGNFLPILSANVAIVGLLPCPPRPGCDNDLVLNP